MAALGIDMLSVFGLPPIEFVQLAAELGCKHISTGLTSFGFNPHGYSAFSLREDRALRRDLITAMTDNDVSISLGEGLTIHPKRSASAYRGDLDIMRELGIQRVNTVSMDPDLSRSFDEFGLLAELAGERGMVSTVELAPSLPVCDLPTAIAAVRHVGRSDFRLLIDTMHLVRSGGGPADIAKLDPKLIEYIQVSDAPREPAFRTYSEESMFERMCPGTGELGLSALIEVLPHDRVFAIEVPQRSLAQAGVGPGERLGKCVAATREMLAMATKRHA